MLALVLALSSLPSARAAEATDDVSRARADYAAGAAAYDRNDYATAAVRFARADERVPNTQVLRLAMAAALLGSDANLGMALARRAEERATQGVNDGGLAELARKLRARFEDDVTPEPAPADAEPESAPAPPPPSGGSPGLSPAFFWTGVGLTGAAAVTATILTVVVADKHDTFVAQPSPDTASAGAAAQDRARGVWIAAGALAVATGVVAFFTDFRAATPKAAARAARWDVGVGPGAAAVRGTF